MDPQAYIDKVISSCLSCIILFIDRLTYCRSLIHARNRILFLWSHCCFSFSDASLIILAFQMSQMCCTRRFLLSFFSSMIILLIVNIFLLKFWTNIINVELTKCVNSNTFIDADAIRTIAITSGTFLVVLIAGVRSWSTYAFISQCKELVAFIKRQLSACTYYFLMLSICNLGLKVTKYVREEARTSVETGDFSELGNWKKFVKGFMVTFFSISVSYRGFKRGEDVSLEFSFGVFQWCNVPPFPIENII